MGRTALRVVAARTGLVLFLLPAVAHAGDDRLGAAVDRPAPRDRAKAARDLADAFEGDLDGLLGLAAAFPTAARERRTGAWTETVEVPVGADGKTVRMEIALYVPDRYHADRPWPLLFAHHGAGGRGESMTALWRGTAEAQGFLVAAPTEPGENEGYGFTEEERDAAMAALRWVRRNFSVDENRIHLTGVSRGGHLAWDLALRHPDRWASLVPMIGGPRLDTRGQNNLRYLENVCPLPIRDLQGEGDDPRMLFNVRLAFERLQAAGARDAKLLTFPELGHDFRFDAVEWESFLPKARRDPQPPRVVRMAATPGEGRAFWAEILETDRGVKESFTPQVRASEWNAMDDDAKRRFLADEAEKHTARLEVERTEPGVYVAKSRGVRKFRLLLDRDAFEPRTPVKVTWNGRARTRRLNPSARVLCEEFVERFDRSFLPVAEFRVP